MVDTRDPTTGQEFVNGKARVEPSSEGLDIFTYDNSSIVASVISNLSLASAAVPAGANKVLVEYYNHNVGVNELCYIRWGAAANQGTCMRLRGGDSYILEVPEAGTRQINIIGQTGVSGSTFVRITPLG
jgi:hypothetical protein